MVAGRHGDDGGNATFMKVLVVGYGSIGRRHVGNLINYDAVEKIIVYSKIKEHIGRTDKKNITMINAADTNLSTAVDQSNPDFAIIANETYKHMDTAITLAQKEVHLFIEKPLSHNLEKMDVLKEIIRKKNLKVFIAYNLRFLPAIEYLRDQIRGGEIGVLYFAQIEAGQYLPSWRPNTDYAACYSADEKRGGGVALDLSHEIDYMRYLFGEPQNWKTIKSKASDLKINAEDIFAGIYRYSNGFICQVHMDYLQQKPKRTIRIVGSKGQLYCDLVNKYIDVQTSGQNTRLTEDDFFNTAETYNKELAHFITALGPDRLVSVSFDDGIKALELLEDSHDRQS